MRSKWMKKKKSNSASFALSFEQVLDFGDKATLCPWKIDDNTIKGINSLYKGIYCICGKGFLAGNQNKLISVGSVYLIYNM